jgi:P27 family predicted phage terminase small subunit
MTESRPSPPKSLGEPGAALWATILSDLEADWQLDARELHLLERACRCEDEMRELEKAVDAEGATARGSKGQVVAHPGILEARQLKLAQLRLLSALELEDPSTAVSRATPATARARKAARSRWGHG